MQNTISNISNIETVLVSGLKAYRIELKPNYSFDFSGSDVTIVSKIWDIKEITKHIVFCNGT